MKIKTRIPKRISDIVGVLSFMDNYKNIPAGRLAVMVKDVLKINTEILRNKSI